MNNSMMTTLITIALELAAVYVIAAVIIDDL